MALFALGAALAACTTEAGDNGPEPASDDEQQALSDAAEMLGQRPAEDAAQPAEDGN